MKQETATYADYGSAVATATGRADVQALVDAIRHGDDLALDTVLAEYTRASEAFATALEAALASGDADLITRGEELLQVRVANEQQMAGVATAGR